MTPTQICIKCNKRSGDACTISGQSIRAHIAAKFCGHPEGAKHGSSSTPENWSEICRLRSSSGHGTKPEPPAATPHDKWPRWALRVERSKHRKPSDIGVGDTLRNKYAKVGGEVYKKWRKRLGIPCNCQEKQAKWNAMYPYSSGGEFL